jgi:hypothetical protein
MELCGAIYNMITLSGSDCCRNDVSALYVLFISRPYSFGGAAYIRGQPIFGQTWYIHTSLHLIRYAFEKWRTTGTLEQIECDEIIKKFCQFSHETYLNFGLVLHE